MTRRESPNLLAALGARALSHCYVSWPRFRTLVKQADQLRRDVIDVALDVVLCPLRLVGRVRCGFILRRDAGGNWLDAHFQRVAEIEKRRSLGCLSPSVAGHGLLHSPTI